MADIETTKPTQEELERAKELISKFCRREYLEEADFSDLNHVSLAYTDYEELVDNDDDEYQTVQVNVYADLEKYEIVYKANSDDLESTQVETYRSLTEMCDKVFEYMDFDGLVECAMDYYRES